MRRLITTVLVATAFLASAMFVGCASQNRANQPSKSETEESARTPIPSQQPEETRLEGNWWTSREYMTSRIPIQQPQGAKVVVNYSGNRFQRTITGPGVGWWQETGTYQYKNDTLILNVEKCQQQPIKPELNLCQITPRNESFKIEWLSQDKLKSDDGILTVISFRGNN